MDSIYQAIQNQPDLNFNRLVEIYSDDKQSRWIECLETTSEFENVAFSLAKGMASQPFFTPEGIHILKVMDREETAAYENVSARLMERLRRKEILDKGTGAVLERLKKHGSMLPIRRQWKNCWRKAVQNKPCLRLTDKHTPELCSRILPLLILKLSNGSWKDL